MGVPTRRPAAGEAVVEEAAAAPAATRRAAGEVGVVEAGVATRGAGAGGATAACLGSARPWCGARAVAVGRTTDLGPAALQVDVRMRWTEDEARCLSARETEDANKECEEDAKKDGRVSSRRPPFSAYASLLSHTHHTHTHTHTRQWPTRRTPPPSSCTAPTPRCVREGEEREAQTQNNSLRPPPTSISSHHHHHFLPPIQ